MSDIQQVDKELRQAIARLELISHGPTQNFDPTPRDTSDEPGGRKPGRSDVEPRPRDFDERMAWEESYHRKTVSYFNTERRQALESFDVERLSALRDDALACFEAWRKRPITKGDPPSSRKDSNWKRYIVTTNRDSGDLARQYGCTRRYINKIRAMEWSVTELELEQEALLDQARRARLENRQAA